MRRRSDSALADTLEGRSKNFPQNKSAGQPSNSLPMLRDFYSETIRLIYSLDRVDGQSVKPQQQAEPSQQALDQPAKCNRAGV